MDTQIKPDVCRGGKRKVQIRSSVTPPFLLLNVMERRRLAAVRPPTQYSSHAMTGVLATDRSLVNFSWMKGVFRHWTS
jgi:hypothetical protein